MNINDAAVLADTYTIAILNTKQIKHSRLFKHLKINYRLEFCPEQWDNY